MLKYKPSQISSNIENEHTFGFLHLKHQTQRKNQLLCFQYVPVLVNGVFHPFYSTHPISVPCSANTNHG